MGRYLKSVFYVGIVAYIFKLLSVITEVIAYSELGNQMGFPVSVNDLQESNWYSSVLKYNQFFYLFLFIFMFSLVVIFAVEKKNDIFSDLLLFTALVNGFLFYGFYRDFSFVRGNVSGEIGNIIFIAFFYSLYRIFSKNSLLLTIVILRTVLLFVGPLYETNPVFVNIVILASSVLTVIGLYKVSKIGNQISEAQLLESQLAVNVDTTNG